MLKSETNNMKEVALRSKEYPAALREIPHPPEKLWVWGALPSSAHWLAVVGTRHCTAYGREITKKFIAALALHDFCIVSGLAFGIDTAAHQAALEAYIPTVAVLGSGIDSAAFHPSRNLRLAQDIVARGGAVISEYEPDFKATLWSFPQRNRIISGLSRAVLVVEAPERSGALITAHFALDQNRDVFAVPGSVLFSQSIGTNQLIQQGALLVHKAEDILRAYGIEETARAASEESLSLEEKKILSLLDEPRDINSLIRQSSFAPAQAQTIVGMLEIRGIIKRIGSEYIKNI
ncbi:DNA protecting protein DprA [Candidatus Giovannonibacteria bacterium RIFCSPHIGHO2_02_FULL_46_20]|uniref:DNA protecting protein DprA n=1 Tax=Candidatus Giovannonibacteria bacterium RIFCSPHIGHO2_02_FULL_46_20 TaxID=1798338 RepID=A0A1F5WG00_9BACT|nr:MAG: DNA protecting protein DprA [Candidatus Giovannonibacteria bacterium RIFCSPHIGHO2_02_FULL_46_20]